MATDPEIFRLTATATAAEKLRKYLSVHALNTPVTSTKLEKHRTQLQTLYEAELKAISNDLPDLIKYLIVQALANRLELPEDSLKVSTTASHLTEKKLLSAARDASSIGIVRIVQTLSNTFTTAGIPKKNRPKTLQQQILSLEEAYTAMIEHLGSRLFVWGALSLRLVEDSLLSSPISPQTIELYQLLIEAEFSEILTANDNSSESDNT